MESAGAPDERNGVAAPILTTKLHIPSLRRNLVSRGQLLDRLDQGLQHKLTVVSAPAGFGKTTLLSTWAEGLRADRVPPVRVAWLSLDEGDNDPARFAAYLAAALGELDVQSSQAGEDALEWGGSALHESRLAAWINQVAARAGTFVVVLDDYHLITAQGIHDALAFLIDHLPDNLHLVLATRADPPLPLPRLRARGQLTELRQSDLRFTTEEAAAFLNQVMGLDLSARDAAILEARTEGWIAGLQMASLAMQAQPSPSGQEDSEFVRAFGGSHRFVLDYLTEEVLQRQPEAVRRFLLHTSILDRLCAPLCGALLDMGDWGLEGAQPDYLVPHADNPTQRILEHLEASNLFIVPLDQERHWYRYHRLFADLLRKRLGQASPDLVPALHRRASAWYEQAGLVAEAIDHALAARDFERAAALVEGAAEATLMRSEATTFLQWVERLPDSVVRTRPNLCFYHAWVLLMSGRSLDAVEQRLEDIACLEDGAEISADMAGRMAAMRAYHLVLQADLQQAAKVGRQALAHLSERSRYLRSIVTWIISVAHLMDGDTQDSRQGLEELARTSQKMGNPLIAVSALSHHATLQARQGRLHRARETYERALQWATDPQGGRLPIASEALIGLGRLRREWNDLEAAADHLTESIELASRWSELAAFDAYFPLAATRLAQGDVQAAQEAIETARRLADRSEITQLDDLLADLQQARFSISQGDVEGATRWAQSRGLIPGPSPASHLASDDVPDFISAHLHKYEQIMLARLFLLQGRAVEALDLLQPLLGHAKDLGRIDLAIEIQILRALAYQAQGDDGLALDALAAALSLAEPGGYIRIFLDEGEPMLALLARAAARGIAPAYVATLLAAHGPEPAEAAATSPHPQPLVEPLSERELEVLRLLATGMSNPDIADELYIAVSTVRSHCKNIYGKLGVHSRWDAGQRGRELGLI